MAVDKDWGYISATDNQIFTFHNNHCESNIELLLILIYYDGVFMC